MKTILICLTLHRELSIASATSGLTIQIIADRAIRLEIDRMKDVIQKKKVCKKGKKVSVKV